LFWILIKGNKMKFGSVTDGYGAAISGVGGLVRPYPIDSSDLHAWKLDESNGASSFVNSGTSSLILSPHGTVRAGNAGIWSKSVSLYDTSSYLFSVATTDQPLATSITASIWIYYISSSNSFAFSKMAQPINWDNPYASWMILVNGSTYFAITTANDGWIAMPSSSGFAPDMVVNTWNHVGLTYDGSLLSGYINGNLVKTQSLSGNIVYATNGPYIVGSDGRGSAPSVRAFYADARVTGIVRPESWFSSVYQRGLYGA
jgi:hypothetical protein